MEFAWENRHFDDLIRWKFAKNALTRPIYGLLDPNELKTKVVDAGLWFFPGTPQVDEDGLVDFSAIVNQGLIKLLGLRNFDASPQYLWLIPATEVLINEHDAESELLVAYYWFFITINPH